MCSSALLESAMSDNDGDDIVRLFLSGPYGPLPPPRRIMLTADKWQREREARPQWLTGHSEKWMQYEASVFAPKRVPVEAEGMGICITSLISHNVHMAQNPSLSIQGNRGEQLGRYLRLPERMENVLTACLRSYGLQAREHVRDDIRSQVIRRLLKGPSTGRVNSRWLRNTVESSAFDWLRSHRYTWNRRDLKQWARDAGIDPEAIPDPDEYGVTRQQRLRV